MIERRAFLKAAGSGLIATLLPDAAEAFARSDAIFAAAYKDASGNYGLAILSEQGRILKRIPLPARGHGITVSWSGDKLIAIARRPGTFAMALKTRQLAKPVIFTCPANRHFYGHGLFSNDERLFFATENDFENARGVIGIYDRNSNYRRIGEYSSYGLGPHEITLMNDGQIICIANGGIETHPEFGRQKLNLHRMKPSVVFINVATGDLIEKHVLPGEFNQLSTRHLSVDQQNNIWIGCQYQGETDDLKPLIAKVSMGLDLEFPEFGEDDIALFRNYIGSVSCNHNNQSVAFSSLKGDVSLIIDTRTNAVLKTINRTKICGIAPSKDGYVFSTETGEFAVRKHNLFWDNHIGTNQFFKNSNRQGLVE